jgi:IS4 transposase
VEKAERKLKRRDQKQQQRVLPETIELARYMMLFTSIPNDKLTLKEVLELYRYRWQIELLFKRFKSLAQLGHLPKHEKESAKAWLYGKLLIILLTEKAIVMAKKFSPGGTDTPGQAVSQSVA